MRTYLSLFRLRLISGLQYRAAALSGMVTQMIWGFLLIQLFFTFNSSIMGQRELATYFWLSQATFTLTALWNTDASIYQDIEQGNIIYQCTRPINLYHLWLAQNLAYRVSRCLLRSIPMLIIALFLPSPYRLLMPANITVFLVFMVSLSLSLLTQCVLNNFLFALTIIIKNSRGVRIFFTALFDFFDGSTIPYPFFPSFIQNLLQLTFFYSIKTIPFLIYTNKISLSYSLAFQVIWLIFLFFISYKLLVYALNRLEVYGG